MTIEKDGAFETEDWIKAKPAEFDLISEYKELIVPKIKEIEAICHELGMPFHMRFFMQQTPDGNSSATTSYMAGVDRATPELLGLTLMDELDHSSPMRIAGLVMAAVQKFGGEDANPGIFMP